MKARIIKTTYIEAAYRDAGAPGGVSGNSYRIDLLAEGEVDPAIGWVVDYADLKNLFEPVRRQLDHHCLSDIPGLENNASPEGVQDWIEARLRPWPPWFAGVRVSLAAPEAFKAAFLPPDPVQSLPERLAFSFAAAQSLPQLPEGHPCRSLHGHAYQVELAADASLETLVEAAKSIHASLNNTYINTLPGLEQATAERIAAWIWRRLTVEGCSPTLTAVQETPNNRCHYYGE